jgi:hypothetical protein
MMRIFTIIFLMISFQSYGQEQYMDCLDLEDKLELFIPQFRRGTKIKPITEAKEYFKDSLYIKVNFSKVVRYDNDFKGMAIELINTTNQEFVFENSAFQDFFCQVESNGQWITIERKRELWHCVYVELRVPSNSFVTAILPCYKGTKSVKMRYRFAMSNKVLYSEEFQGTIKPRVLK